jgi:hypothetical protein
MLYHKEVGFPKEVEEYYGRTFNLTLSVHASRACHSDRYGNIAPPLGASITPENLFEVEMIGNEVTKLAIRRLYNKKIDISIVMMPLHDSPLCAFVKTIWLNRASDTHSTLDKSKYAIPS